MPAKTWQQNMLGITFRYADGRITVFRSALESIGRPEFYHFLYNPTKQMFAIQACGMDAEGAIVFQRKIRTTDMRSRARILCGCSIRAVAGTEQDPTGCRVLSIRSRDS